MGSRGASHRILLMCDGRVVEKVVVVFTITCSFRNVSDNFAWAFAGVYGPNIDHERMLLWDELAGLLSW